MTMNKLMRMAQHDAEPSGYNDHADQSVLNTILNRRMEQRFPGGPGMNALLGVMSQRIPHMMTPPGYENRLRGSAGPSGEGGDMDMLMMYGPEDQVVFDQQGRPIPLNDPRHPRSQQSYQPVPAYPQQRR